MSLECTLWQVSPEKLKLYKSSEDSVEEFIDFCFPETFDEDVFTDESKTKKFYDKDLCLEKRWHLLHYLLTGDEDTGNYPLSHAIVGGYSINEIWSDLKFIEPHEVNDVANALNDIPDNEFRKRSIGELFAGKEIYKYQNELDDKEIIEILQYFSELKGFYLDAAKKGNAVMHFIS